MRPCEILKKKWGYLNQMVHRDILKAGSVMKAKRGKQTVVLRIREKQGKEARQKTHVLNSCFTILSSLITAKLEVICLT